MQGRVGSWLRQRHQEEPLVALLNTGDVYTLRYFLVYMRVHITAELCYVHSSDVIVVNVSQRQQCNIQYFLLYVHEST